MLRPLSDKRDEYMPFRFDRRKAVQAVAVLLKIRPNHQDSYMRLLKILYIADRESIRETGSPITGDTFVAMKHGTMLSRLLNLARHTRGHLDREADHAEWRAYIAKEPRHEIRLIQDPGCGALCEYEVNKLNEVAKRYESYSKWAMRRVTHALPEYHNPLKEGKLQKWIGLREFLGAVNMGSVADEIEGEAKGHAEFRHLMGG